MRRGLYGRQFLFLINQVEAIENGGRTKDYHEVIRMLVYKIMSIKEEIESVRKNY